MGVAREVSGVASPTEGYVAPEAAQNPAEHLREVADERQRWISKQKEWLARKEELQKLLKLQDAKTSNNDLITPQTTDIEVDRPLAVTQKGEDKAAQATEVAVARKKELKELQDRTEAAKEKLQQAATVLTSNLRQLKARRSAQLARTHQSTATKRKREEDGAEEQPNKKADIVVGEVGEASGAALEMHPFAPAPDLDLGTARLAEATCFRIATRYFLTTGTRIPRDMLQQAFKEYTGNTLDEVVDASELERFIEYVDTDVTKPTTHRSGLEKRARRVWWQPGRQFLRTPTFVYSNAEQIQALIDVEKQIVVDVCGTLLMSGNQRSRSTTLKNMRRQNQFLASLLSDSNAEPNSLTLSNILSACIGVDSSESTANLTKRIPYRSHGQMAGVFVNMESWLREQADAVEPQTSVRGPQKDSYFSTTRHTTPFCIENDSVVKQLRGVGAQQTSATKKIDPFKVLCQYELNGVCNDKNCSNYHQNDYYPVLNKVFDPSAVANGATRAPNPKEKNQLLLLFAEFRGRILEKWPVITATKTSLAAAENDKPMNFAAADASSADSGVAVVKNMQRTGDIFQDDNDDFIMLDAAEELPEIGDSRFFDDIESRKGYGDSLQARVEKDPNDTDAWILLAIYHLELDVGLSDDAVNLTDDVRLQQQLIFLCKELSGRHSSSSFRDLHIEEENLKRCLHTLSRSLEVEANAYCEALWLLYIHLCKQAANKQTEIEMVEQAVQFLPSSHALWLRYIATYDFDSVRMAEGIYWRLMEHLARVNSTEDGVDDAPPSKEVSILLTAMCFHLCIKLWRAGATSRVLELLSALLHLGDSSSDFEWCGTVRCHLRSDEMIIFYLVLAHASLFNELPALIEHWVEASSCESIPINGMAYTVESLSRDSFDTENNFAQVLAFYERAFSIYEEKCSGTPGVGGVILSNWMLLLSLQNDDNTRDESLKIFFADKLGTIQQYPTAALTAAKIMGLTSTGKQQAHELMLTMMNQSSEKTFPEALHHYLFANRVWEDLVNDLDKIFPDVMKRLASHMECDIDAVEKSIQDILHDTSNVSKSCALGALLDSLLTAWMNQLDLQRRKSQQCQSLESPERSSADIYVALAICQLMRVLLGVSVAIDGLQIVLSSPSFGVLSLEARQIAWMQRFVFQMDLFQSNDDELSLKERQAKLIQLFRKYTGEMSVKTEILRQVSNRIKHDLTRNALEDAVRDCLYPERSCLITYDVSLELFRLCSAAVPGPEKASFCASFTNVLALASEFSLTFSDTAVHEWELLAARASLRKCLGGTKTQHCKVLQALVALELRLRNMKSVSSLLQNELCADPLILETWRLVMALEILFGDNASERSEKIAAEIKKRQLVAGCNTFGDDIAPCDVVLLLSKDSEAATSLSLRGFGLEYVPNAVLLKNELLSLDLSGNELTELPNSLNRLKNLQKLDASENALVDVPQCLDTMAHLGELSVAHNNLSMAPTLHLRNVSSMNMSWNRVEHLAVADVATLKSMKMLRAEGNAIPADDLSKISDLLSSRKETTPVDVGVVSSQNSSQPTSAKVSEEQSSHTSLSGNFSAGGDEDSAVHVAVSAEANTSAANDISSVTAKEEGITSAALGDDIDRVVNIESIARMTKDDEGDQIMDDVEANTIAPEENNGEVVDDPTVNSNFTSKEGHTDVDADEVNLTSFAIQANQGEVVDDHDASSTLMSNENHINEDAKDANMTSVSSAHITEQDESVVDIEDPAMLISVESTNTTQQPKEVIAVDSSESSEESESDEEEQDQTASNNTDVSADTTNKEIMPMTVTDDTESTAAAEFAQDYWHGTTEATRRQGGDPEAGRAVLRKLTAYMEQNEIGNRSEVRMRNPTLWQEFIAANLPEAESMWGPCRLCFAPSDGNNQRLNCTALCLHCLEQAVDVLKKRRDDLEQ